MVLRSLAYLWVVLLLGAGCARTQLQFRITAPASTPEDAELAVYSDDDAALREGVLLQREGELWTADVEVAAPSSITYELRLRNPDRAELTLAWEPVAPRVVEVPEDAEAVEILATVQRWEELAPAGKVALTFEVTVPSSTGSELWVTGGDEGLGGWQVRGVRAYRNQVGAFVARAFVTPESTHRYAVTRGHWGAVERGTNGQPLPEDRTVQVGAAAHTEAITVAGWTGSRDDWRTGTIDYLGNVSSAHVNTRGVLVWLPPGYGAEGNTARYPVLYMHDGQNLMNGRSSFAGEWHADETAQRLVEHGLIEPLIIVGVYNTSARIPEYTPVPMAQYPGSGQADAYGRFLVEELKPLIDSTYRTRSDADSTGLAGSSLGGLVSMYFGLQHSDVFTRLGVVSPSVWWADRDIVGQVSALSAQLPLRIWVDIGTQEGNSSGETVNDTRLLRDALIAEGWSLGEDLAYLEAPGAGHNEAAWARRFDEILQFLYPPQ